MAGKVPISAGLMEDGRLRVPGRLLVMAKMPVPEKVPAVGDLLGMKKLPRDWWLLVPGRKLGFEELLGPE